MTKRMRAIFITIIAIMVMAIATVAVNASSGEIVSVSLSETNVTMNAGQSKGLGVSASAYNMTSAEIKAELKNNADWESSNTSVATVNNGTVKAKKAGTATITVDVDGNEASCTIIVNNVPPTKENTTAAYKQLNKYRKAKHRKALKRDKKLEAIALQRAKEMAETAKKSIVNDTPAQPLIDMLLSDTLKVTFPTDATNESDEDAEDVLYMVAMDEKGIRCIKNGSDTYEWEIEFEDDSQYEAARDFLGWASPRMDNLLFAAHDNFWMDYLNGDLDVDAFKDFLEGTNNGIPNYGIGDEENMYIDETKIQWTKYMNPLGAHFGTPEELFPIPEL